MLVISRLKDQRVKIGEEVWVQIVSSREGGRVQLGIEAPKDVKIMREELLEKNNDAG